MPEPMIEGPNPSAEAISEVTGVTFHMNANSQKNWSATTDLGENRLHEYNLLKQQIENGQYDGDGPADVAPVKE